MFLNQKEIVFIFFVVTILLLVFVYLTICDIVIGRYIFFIFNSSLPLIITQGLEEIIKREGYVMYNVVSSVISTAGASYCGELFAVEIEGETVEQTKITSLFFKKKPVGGNTLISINELYSKEYLMYSEILHIFAELQEEAKVPNEQRFKTANSYHQSSDEVIILENLALRGFNTLPKQQVMSLQYAERAVQELAKFHSLSFVIQKLRTGYFMNTIIKSETPFKWSHLKPYAIDLMNKTVDIIVDEETRKRANFTIPYILKRFPKHFVSSMNSVNCLCHGDYRQSNILMRVEDNIKDLIIVDYQLIHYGCPLNDFIYLIYCGTDRQFRQKHLEHLKELYYEAMDKFLQYFNIEVKQVFPCEVYDQMFLDARDFGLSMIMIFGALIFTSETEIVDVSKDTRSQTTKTDPCFQKIFKDMIDDFVEWGYIPPTV